MTLACGQPRPYKVKKNLAYGELPDQTFDLYEPPYPSTNRPLIVAIHGGAWQSGDKVWGKNIAEELCWRGYVVASINYRLAPQHKWPAQIEDCQLALQYFQNASWMQINPQRIGVFGHSAGGHLASMLLLRPLPEGVSRPVAGVSASGEGDLVSLRDQDQNLNALLQPELPGMFSQESLLDVSPVNFVNQETKASLLLIHAVGDTNVIYDHAVLLSQALLRVNADVQLYTLFNASHNRSYQEGMDTAISFLNARGLRPSSSADEKKAWRVKHQAENLFD